MREKASGAPLCFLQPEPLEEIAPPVLDPLANLDLASATPLRPVARPRQSSGLPLTPQKLAALLAAAGVAILLLILAFPLAAWLLPAPTSSKSNQPASQPRTPAAVNQAIAGPAATSCGKGSGRKRHHSRGQRTTGGRRITISCGGRRQSRVSRLSCHSDHRSLRAGLFQHAECLATGGTSKCTSPR